MNIKILAASVALLGAMAMSPARADDHGRRGGGHWSQDSRGGHDGRGWRDGGRAGHWGGDGRGRYEGHGYRNDGWRHDSGRGRDWDHDRRGGWGGRDWDHDRHEGWRREHWRHGYRPYWGYRSDYSYAPRYYAPYYYAPSYYAPGPWGGWFDDAGVVIQFTLP